MGVSWLFVALAVAVVPLGSRGSLRLAALAGQAAVERAGTSLPPVAADSLGRFAAITTGGVIALTADPVLGLAASLAISTAATLVAAAGRRSERRRRQEAAASAVHVVRAEVDAGADVAAAVRAAADGVFAADLRAVGGAASQAGEPVDDIAAELCPLAHAVRVSIASGAQAGTVLETVSDQLQSGLDQQAAVTSALAGARSSAVLLALLPALGVALGAGLGVNPMRVLLGTPAGHVLVLIGITLECAGLRWTSRLASSAEGALA